jgi:hypothetical protein
MLRAGFSVLSANFHCHADRREASHCTAAYSLAQRVAVETHSIPTPACSAPPGIAESVRSFAEFTLEWSEGLTMTWEFMEGTQRESMTRRVAAMLHGVAPRNQ